MDQTDIWMLGVAAFGVVFYLLSLYYGRKGRGVKRFQAPNL